MRHPYAPFWEAARRHGPVFTIRLAGQPTWVSVGDPVLVERVFRAAPDELEGATDVMRMLLPEGALVLLQGDAHRRMRRTLAPFFQPEPMARHAEVMRRAIDAAIDGLVPGQRVRLLDLYAGVTLRTIVECVFGVTREALRRELEQTMTLELRRLARPDLVLATLLFSGERVGRFLAWIEERARSRAERSVMPLGNLKAKLRRLVRDELTKGRARPSARRDLLGRLLDAKDEAGAPLADDVLYAQLRSILLGAHDTSAITLSWATHFVLRDPEASELIGAGRAGQPEAAHVDAVLKETLRIRPVAHHTARVATRAFALGPYEVPKGAYVLPSQAVTHFREALWDAPHEFRPGRFLEATPSPYQYFPFGGGSRACLGRAFALAQMRILLTRMLERVTLRPAPGADPRPAMCGLLVGPSDGVPVVIEGVR